MHGPHDQYAQGCARNAVADDGGMTSRQKIGRPSRDTAAGDQLRTLAQWPPHTRQAGQKRSQAPGCAMGRAMGRACSGRPGQRRTQQPTGSAQQCRPLARNEVFKTQPAWKRDETGVRGRNQVLWHGIGGNGGAFPCGSKELGTRGDNSPPDSSVHVHPPTSLFPSFSAREFRDALGMFATGSDHRHGPQPGRRPGGPDGKLLQFRLSRRPSSCGVSRAAQPPWRFWPPGAHYAINVLAADQKELAERFAMRGVDRWAGVAHQPGVNNAPAERRRGHVRVLQPQPLRRGRSRDLCGRGGTLQPPHRRRAAALPRRAFYTEHPL